MNIYETILVMIIFMLFPFVVELLYQVTYQNQNQKINPDSYLIAVITSCYFLVRFGLDNPLIVILFLNIPLLMIYQKNDVKLGIILSIIISVIGIIYTNIPWFIFMMDYLSLLFIYKIYQKEKISFSKYILIFDAILIINIMFFKIDKPISYYILIILSFIILSFLTDLIKKYGENAICFHRTLKDLEEEKQLRMSLFQITHEIKNPITVCKGYLDMFDINNKEHLKKFIPIIKEEIARVLILIEDFLQITKIKINKDLMDATMLLEENQRNFELLFKKNNIDCEFNIPNDEIYIYADYQRLNQVLINLIKNGMEALDKNKKMEVSMKIKNSNLEIIVKDYGKGMDKEQLAKIKTPFFTTKQGGTGLGLYLSDEIIKAHDGSLVYNSKKDIGTTVCIKLPYKKDVKIS